ncbi:MAG TPA: phage capsid protein [Paracoccaceae bacterium]|nr:phage capsid protein [Paracoccaceae bacterium]HMO70086.1 phage capsid protein [Paracoccaceae bacterium]
MSAYAMKVEQHHKLMYAASVQMVAQQKRNALENAVTTMPASGEAMSAADLLDAGEYVYEEDRTRRNVEVPVTGSRRWLVRPPVIKSGDYIDLEDKFATATDPTSSYVRVHTTRVLRGKQDRILGVRKEGAGFTVADGGILGSAISGKRPGGAPTALPSGQVVPHDSAGLTIGKLREAVRLLRLADFGIEDDDPMYGLISPNQADDLLAIAEESAVSLNAFNIEELRSGKPRSLMGITWIMTNRLPHVAETRRLIPLFSKRNIAVGIWQDVQGDIWNDTHADNKPYARVSAYIDAVRIEDRGVIAIECNEA